MNQRGFRIETTSGRVIVVDGFQFVIPTVSLTLTDNSMYYSGTISDLSPAQALEIGKRWVSAGAEKAQVVPLAVSEEPVAVKESAEAR